PSLRSLRVPGLEECGGRPSPAPRIRASSLPETLERSRLGVVRDLQERRASSGGLRVRRSGKVLSVRDHGGPGDGDRTIGHDGQVRATVLIVDDSATFRRFARKLLERDGFTVVGEAGDCASALAAAEELAPDAVLLDVMLPDGSGLDIAATLAQR